MPRIPQVFASPDIGGSVAPPRAPMSFGDTSEAQRGLAQLSHSARVYASAKDTLSDEQDKLTAELALGEYKKAYAEADVRMQQDPSLTPDNYAERVDENLRAAREGVEKSIQSPRARTLYSIAAEKFTTQQSIEGKYEGLKLSHALVRSNGQTVLAQDKNEAVFAPTVEAQQAAQDRGLARIDNWAFKKIYTPKEAEDLRAGFLADIEDAKADNWARDPALLPQVLNGLTSGGYPNLGPVKSMKKARDLAKQATDDQRTMETDGAKQLEMESKIWVTGAIDSFNTGDPADRYTREQMRRGIMRYAGHISPETQKSLYEMVERPEKEGGITRPEVYNDLRIRILARLPGTTTDTILRESPDRLSSTSKAELIKQINQMAKEDDISNDPHYKKGREQIMILLGGVSTGLPEMLGLPILKPAEAENLARVLHNFDKAARTQMYVTQPELLSDLGRYMALSAKGQGAGPATPAQPPAGAPAVQLPRLGDVPKPQGSKKAVPR